ncbi:MAG: hypothetical protein NT027_18110 [Proteobacteria bacterium]|nr:hypothetical protein [Pseudomonadota bacterium]
MKIQAILFLFLSNLVLWSHSSYSQEIQSGAESKNKTTNNAKNKSSKKQKPKLDKPSEFDENSNERRGPNTKDDVVAVSSTKIDFSETSIDGQMKAPEGFFLQGHTANSLSQMVKLRSNFRNELRNSRSAVKSHVR